MINVFCLAQRKDGFLRLKKPYLASSITSIVARFEGNQKIPLRAAMSQDENLVVVKMTATVRPESESGEIKSSESSVKRPEPVLDHEPYSEEIEESAAYPDRIDIRDRNGLLG